MTSESETVWQTYEEVATYLLNKFANEFGFSHVEGKQSLVGIKTGTKWEIDAKGFQLNGEGFVIIECRRYLKAKQNQEKVGSLAYRILDTGAKGGIVVSPLGLQSGAQLIANAEGIISIKLHENSTSTEFAMQFLNKIFVGIHEKVYASDAFSATLTRHCEKCSAPFSVQKNELACPACSSSA